MSGVSDKDVSEEIDDETISIAFAIGNEREREDALRALHQKYRFLVAHRISTVGPGLSPDAVVSAVQDTFVNLFRLVTAGEFDEKKRLLPLIFTLAKRRAIDELRKKFSCQAEFLKKLQSDDEFAEHVGRHIIGTDAGFQWRMVTARNRAAEVQEILRQIIPTLPPLQRLVAQIASPHFWDITDKDIADAIFEVTGERHTVVSIRSARNQIRAKVGSKLQEVTK